MMAAAQVLDLGLCPIGRDAGLTGVKVLHAFAGGVIRVRKCGLSTLPAYCGSNAPLYCRPGWCQGMSISCRPCRSAPNGKVDRAALRPPRREPARRRPIERCLDRQGCRLSRPKSLGQPVQLRQNSSIAEPRRSTSSVCSASSQSSSAADSRSSTCSDCRQSLPSPPRLQVKWRPTLSTPAWHAARAPPPDARPVATRPDGEAAP